MSHLLIGQSNHLIDALYEHDFTEISTQKADLKQAEILQLRKDFGLSTGFTMGRRPNEEIESGLEDNRANTARVYAKANLWNDGYKQNLLQAEILQKELEIEQIEGDAETLNYNHAVYYNYLIYHCNLPKMELLQAIQLEANKLEAYFKELYYEKLIGYDKILNVQAIKEESLVLFQSHQSYNQVFEEMGTDIDFTSDTSGDLWSIDFAAMAQYLASDTINQQIVHVRQSIVDDRKEISNLPNFSMSLGYDLSRAKPFYNLNFSFRIDGWNRQTSNVQKQMIEARSNMKVVQKQKELLNVQYEYEYKRKQFRHLQHELKRLAEQRRVFNVKRQILSLEESLEERHLELDRLLLEYEILDLQQQSLLQLLQLKRIIYPLRIGIFIKDKWQSVALKRYPYKRFLLVEDGTILSQSEQQLLNNNEIRQVNAEELIRMKNIVIIYPDEFENRREMEAFIAASDPDSIFLINDLPSFKALELRTIRAKAISQASF